MRATDRYKTPVAFKTALEERVRRRAASEGTTMDRVRQLLLFDRFIARANESFGDRLLLKGGVVLELRLERARATGDIDWRMVETPPEKVLEELQRAAAIDLGDEISFLVTVEREAPAIEGTIYDGLRFRVDAQLAGKRYGSPFGVDVAFGDPIVGPIDEKLAPAYLDFIDVPPTKVRLYPRSSHVAEKLHAFTLPRPTPNSRVKDLPDILCRPRFPQHRPHGRSPTRVWRRRTSCLGRICYLWRRQYEPSLIPRSPRPCRQATGRRRSGRGSLV
jgi:hypothetical protein